MSESENKESLTIARFSLYATLIGAVLAALTLIAPFIERSFSKPPVEAAAPISSSNEVADVLPLSPAPPPAPAAHPLGDFVQLTDQSVRNRTFETALNGQPYVIEAPTEGVWLGKICTGDVIVTVDDDSPPDDISSLGIALGRASTIQLRPADLLDSGPSANIEISSTSARRC